MPTFNDPKADADEAYAALRGLAHATRTFENPADTYDVLGNLLGGMGSLAQVIDQLAGAHLAARHRAFDDTGDQLAGETAAEAAGRELLAVKALLDQAYRGLDVAMSQSGKIAWHPEPPVSALGQVNEADAVRTVEEIGTLKLTVWPITPLGVHHRYGYLIEDQATGAVAGGRDLFTGIEPVTPEQAMRELVIYLQAEGDNRQRALDHPDEPAPELMFPEAIADAAHANDAALDARASSTWQGPVQLAELLGAPRDPVPEPEKAGRWISVVFLHGEDADHVLDLIEKNGPDAAIEHLAGYDFGEETVQAALANGYVYDEPPTGALDRTATHDVYTLTYSPSLGHVALLREYDATPDPALLDIDDPAPVERQEPTAAREARSPRAERSGSSWFGRRTGTASSSQGLAL
ncbi:MAG: hypothetical protein BGN97_10110 [Microbacterium sp. 69-10]|uniref:hypothetical protein n=1 Tax=Microbacterium sp. 69-10 TaxID=1895783 RepID=UPI00095B44EF|nr:hypothetical protein [Microbacterium sp. 69-10]OJU41516.1 MAG: hypothetical protein BGN97_10110 [Microbacterium sp. 69-10]